MTYATDTARTYWHAIAYQHPSDRTAETWAWLAIKFAIPAFAVVLAVQLGLLAASSPSFVPGIHVIPNWLATWLFDVFGFATTLMNGVLAMFFAKLGLRIGHESGYVSPALEADEVTGGDA